MSDLVYAFTKKNKRVHRIFDDDDDDEQINVSKIMLKKLFVTQILLYSSSRRNRMA